MPTIGRLSLWLFFFTFILFFLSNSIVQGESLLSLSLSLPGFLPSLAAAAAARWAPTLITLCRYNSFHHHLFLRSLSQLPISRFRVPPETKNNRSGSCRREFKFFFFCSRCYVCRCQTHWTRPQAARPALLPCLVRGGGGKSSSLSLSRFPKRKNLLRSYYLRTTRRNERKSEEFSLPFFSPFFLFLSLAHRPLRNSVRFNIDQ